MDNENSILGLSTIRCRKGISLEQISNSTKITVRCLRAIEGGDFGKLPGGIYSTSYIRQYARAIDFDESELLAYYHREMGILTPSSEAPKPDSASTPFGGFPRPSTIFGSQG